MKLDTARVFAKHRHLCDLCQLSRCVDVNDKRCAINLAERAALYKRQQEYYRRKQIRKKLDAGRANTEYWRKQNEQAITK